MLRHGDRGHAPARVPRVDDDPNVDVLVAAMDETAGWDATLRLRSWERAHLRLAPGERLLDVGCGLGEAALGLAEDLGDDGEVVGIDVSERMLRVARSNAASRALSRALQRRRCVLPRRARRFVRRRAIRTHAPVARRPGSRGRRDGAGGAARRPHLADRHGLVDVHDRRRRRCARRTGPRRDANGAPSSLQRRPATARPRRRRRLRPAREHRGDADLDGLGPRRVAGTASVASRWRASPTTSSPAVGWRPPTAGGSCRRSTTPRGAGQF